MSESSQEGQVEQNPTSVAIPDNIIKEAVEKAVKTETEKLKDQLATAITPDKLEEIIQADRQRLASQILGKSQESEVDPIHEVFVKNPKGFLEAVTKITLDKVAEQQEKQNEEFARAEQARAEVKSAFEEVMTSRQDILQNQASRQVWMSLYDKSDPNKTEADRMREALVSYDKYMDDLGVDRSKLKHALSVDGSGALPSQGLPKSVSFEESVRQDQKSKHENYLKAIGRA